MTKTSSTADFPTPAHTKKKFPNVNALVYVLYKATTQRTLSFFFCLSGFRWLVYEDTKGCGSGGGTGVFVGEFVGEFAPARGLAAAQTHGMKRCVA